ncbi:MAG: TIGR02206 family membrane protein [Anaerococcus obesiensis]
MNNFMDEFFRRKEDGFVFDSYSFLHLILFAFMVIVAILLYKYRRKIRENKKIYKYVRLIFIFLLAFQQISFLYFICFVRKDTINEALPLYTCRISIYSGFFALIFNSNNLKILTIFLGLIGGIIGLIFPDLMPYSWPHIMYVNFFLTHFLVFWVSLFFLIVDKIKIKKENLKFNLNYAYLSYSPVFTNLLNKLPAIIYFLLAAILYNFSIFLNFYIFKKLKLIEVN